MFYVLLIAARALISAVTRHSSAKQTEFNVFVFAATDFMLLLATIKEYRKKVHINVQINTVLLGVCYILNLEDRGGDRKENINHSTFLPCHCDV